MLASRLLFFSAALCLSPLVFPASALSSTVLVLQFHNNSQYPDLNWVGESVSETLKDEFSAQNQIVFGRESRAEALRRLSLRPSADFTKATLIRLGQSLDADYICYGTYDASLLTGSSELKSGSIQVSAHILDLRKLHDGPDFAEAGRLADLSRLEEHMAWQALRYLAPGLTLPLDTFLSPQKLIRVDAEESYIRGLLSVNKEQQQKWFTQSVALDPKFASPAFELGKLSLERKDYRQALNWLGRVPAANARYGEARFKMGLASYGAGDYTGAANTFRDVAKVFPVDEVYNNLGAAEDQLNQGVAIDDFRRAVDGDAGDPVYQFNLGSALLRVNNFDEASRRLQTAVNQDPNDFEAQDLLARAKRREPSSPGAKPLAEARLKPGFDITVFRQLKALVQPKGGT